MQSFHRDYLLRLPLPLAQLYSRAYNAKDARGRHDNTFYLFEALVKLAAAPAIATYLAEADGGAPRDSALDRLLLQLALPSLGQWLAMLRELARHFGARADAASHPLGHVWSQLRTTRRDLPGVLALYRRMKNGPDAEPAGDQACSLLQLLDALVQYRNAVFGHGAGRLASFYEREMGPLLFPAANEVLAEGTLDPLGPRGSRLVYVTELRALDEGLVEVGLRELVGLQGERAAALQLNDAEARGLAPNRVAVLWPGRLLPLRLDPLLVYREGELAEEVLFLNRDRNSRQVEYLSYTTGRTERDRSTAPALATLLGRAAGRPVSEEQLQALAEQRCAGTPSAESLGAPHPPAGSRLGDFEVLAEVGRGGMGVVYLARQLSLGRLVALKMLPADLAGDEAALTRFRREIRALARCDHPNIVKVLASGAFPDGRLYYAMEYVPGCDLEMVWRELSGSSAAGDATRLGGSTWAEAVLSASRKRRAQTTWVAAAPRWFYARGKDKVGPLPWARLRELGESGELKPADMVLREGAFRWGPASAVAGLLAPPGAADEPAAAPAALPPLPDLPPVKDDPGGYVRRVVRMMRDAALALQAVHDQRLIHRDVKPANLMLTPDGLRVVLMDFGLAKGQSLATSMSRGGGLLGTLRYAAPEQLAAATLDVGPQADVRGLGVTLWELLTRKRLFADAGDEKQLAQRVHDEDVPRLRVIDPAFDADLEAIVGRATERRAADRIPSADRLAQYLQMYLDGRPLPIRPPGARELVGRWVRGHRGLVASAVAIALVALVATAFAFVLVTQAKNRAETLAGKNLDLATTNANLAQQERLAKVDAKKSADDAKKQLGQVYANRGVRAWDEGRHAEALLYFAEALRSDRDDPARTREHEARLAAFWGAYPRLLHVWPHGGQMTCAAFSPDGRLVVTGDSSGDVQLWDAATGAPLLDPPFRTAAGVRVARLSGDGGRVLTHAVIPAGAPEQGAGKAEVRVWDRTTKRSVQIVTADGEEVLDLACNADGSRVLTRTSPPAGGAERFVLWDAATGRPDPLSDEGGGLERALYSADGRRLFTLDRDGRAKVRDAVTGAEASRLGDMLGPVRSVALTPDGRYCLTVSDRAVTVWGTATGKPTGANGGIIKAAGILEAAWLSNDGRLVALATAGDPPSHSNPRRNVSVWDVATGKPLSQQMEHREVVAAVTLTPDGQGAVTLTDLQATSYGAIIPTGFGGLGGQAALGGEVRPASRQVNLPGGLSGAGGLGIVGLPSQDAGMTPGAGGFVKKWDMRPEAVGPEPPAPTPLALSGLAQAVALSPDGTLVLTAGLRDVVVWDFRAGRPAVPPLNCEDVVRAAWLSPDGHRVLTLTAREARLWSLADDNLPALSLDHDAPVRYVSFGPGGRHVLTLTGELPPGPASPEGPAGEEGAEGIRAAEVRLWDAAGRLAGPPRKYGEPVTFAETPAGPRLITTGAVIRVWDAVTGEPVGPALKHEAPARFLGFDPSGRKLFTTIPAKDFFFHLVGAEAVHAWDLESGRPLYPPIREQGRVISSVQTAAGGRFLLMVTAANAFSPQDQVNVRDATTGRGVGKPIRLTDMFITASVTPEGDRILVLTSPNPANPFAIPFPTVQPAQWQLWDLAAGHALAPPAPLPPARLIGPAPLPVSRDGRRFLTYQGTEAAVREAASGQVAHILKHRYPVRNAAYSRDGRSVITQSEGVPERPEEKGMSEVRLWNAGTGEPVSPPIPNRFWSDEVSEVSPDGEHVVLFLRDPFDPALNPSLDPGQQFQVYQLATGLPVTPPIPVDPFFLPALFSADGRRLLFSADSRRLLYAHGGRARILDLAPKNHTPEEWGELAWLLSGGQLDRSGTAAPLAPVAARRLWDRLRATPAGYFAAPPGVTALWHRRESFHAAQRLDWFSAAWHLDRLAAGGAASPGDLYRLGAARGALGDWKAAREALSRAVEAGRRDGQTYYLLGWACAGEGRWKDAAAHYTMALDFEDAPRPAVWRGRGEAYAELKRWREAAADYERLREAGSLLETDRLALALLRLQLGDAGGYQQVCRAGLEWLSKPPPGISVTVSMKNTFAWTASVAPSSGVDRKKVVELAQGAVAAQPKEYAFQSTLGAALYRDGQDKVAVDTLDHAITLHEGGGTAYEWLFLALAHNRLDHHDKARQWLEKAARKLDAHLAPARWREVVELSLLRREAEEVIKGKPGPGK